MIPFTHTQGDEPGDEITPDQPAPDFEEARRIADKFHFVTRESLLPIPPGTPHDSDCPGCLIDRLLSEREALRDKLAFFDRAHRGALSATESAQTERSQPQESVPDTRDGTGAF